MKLVWDMLPGFGECVQKLLQYHQASFVRQLIMMLDFSLEAPQCNYYCFVGIKKEKEKEKELDGNK